MNNQLISIIIPTYNREHLIANAINSVLDQNYDNWELLIVDDASTDNTPEVVKGYLDPRIKFIQSDKNGGNAVARNIGVDTAKGDFIAFLDSDDEYHPDYLEKALKTLNSAGKDTAFLWSGTKTVAVDGSQSDFIWIPKTEKVPNQFLYELHVGIGRGFLIQKECFDDLRFDENLRTAVDTDFLIRLRQKYNYTVLEDIVVTINSQEGSVRTNYAEKKKSYNIIIDKHKHVIDKDKFLRFKWYYKLFWLSLYDGDQRLAHKAFRKIIFSSIKPSFLFFLFSVFKRDKAISLHRKLS